jgi:predicted ATP-dependent protease
MKLHADQLRYRCDLSAFQFSNTAELQAEQTLYGQTRGVRAIDFGLAIDSPGYNIYVLGPVDALRVQRIRDYIHRHAQNDPSPDDWCYVYHFKDKNQALALRFPAGQGRAFQEALAEAIGQIRTEIPQALNSDGFQAQISAVKNQFDETRRAIIQEVETLAAKLSFSLQSNDQGGLMLIPLGPDRQALEPAAIAALGKRQQNTLSKRRQQLEVALDNGFRQIQKLQEAAQQHLDDLRAEVSQQLIGAHLEKLLAAYHEQAATLAYLEQVQADLLSHLEKFPYFAQGAQAEDPEALKAEAEEFFRRYQVNLFVEHQAGAGAPVEFLDFPSYRNLVGRIEHETRYGMLSTDFTLLRSGALHRANGGYLIMRAPDLLGQPLSWAALKRALNTKQVIIEDSYSAGSTVFSTPSVEAQPIPLQLTVVLVGQQMLYYALYEMDDDFRDLFRVKADFGDTMPRNTTGEQQYARFAATRCAQEAYRPFSQAAIGQLVEYGVWLAEEQNKLSTNFSEIDSLMREANFYAGRRGQAQVEAQDVREAIRERDFRNNEIEELSIERILDGSVMLDTDGELVGQINGLVVLSLGDHTFGLPARLTARVFMGRDGINHADKESEMTGNIHDKGVRILEGYLGGRYADDFTMNFTASISFEQNYGEVEGDSASSTELFVLLSALSQIPLRQDLAVTGSVNQRGQIQVIGGVTQKVEGFFKICQARGLTGQQGVIIPSGNVQNLMLNEEVVAAVAAGQFHIYAIESVEEGLELLMSRPAEEVHAAVEARLRQLARDADKDEHEEDSED